MLGAIFGADNRRADRDGVAEVSGRCGLDVVGGDVEEALPPDLTLRIRDPG